MSAPPPAEPRLSAVVVSYETRDDLLRCLAALAGNVTLPHEVIVVDNASTDGSAAAVREGFPTARVIQNAANAGFARACNQGLRAARAPLSLLLNSDAEVRPGAVEAMAALLDARPEVGIVGPRTRNADGTVQVSFGPALTPLAEWRQRALVRAVRARDRGALSRLEALSAVEHEPDWVSGSCLMARAEALRAVGGFDEGFFLYEEDVDLCVRVRRAGYRVVFTPAAEVVHRLGRSMERVPALSRREYHLSHLRYYRKHHGWLGEAVLRAWLAGAAGAGWVAALGPGAARRTRRAGRAADLRVAIRGTAAP
jgi:GT2 family glycosyltransferase